MGKKALLRELSAARNELYAALRGLSTEALYRPDAIDGDSIALLCGHISAWEDRLLTVLQQISQGDATRVRDADVVGPEPDFCRDSLPTNAAFNAAQRRKRHRWPWRDILNELVWTREETGWTLANMPESTLFAARRVETQGRGLVSLCPADIVRQLTAHDRVHAAQIRRWRQWEELETEQAS